ncbi:MAG TPA: hypothetical protein GX693_07185 [Firmicutes bacterium]|nr:hypothetical protein [Bacillota bacterium]
MRLDKFKFIISASLVIILASAINYQLTLQQQMYEDLAEDLSELNQAYCRTVTELQKIEQENRQLKVKLEEQMVKIELIETDKERLEQILINQTRTYRNAIEMNGSTMPVKSLSSFSSQMYEQAWKKLNACALQGTGEAFARAEEQYGINSLVLAAIAYLESGGGTSRIAREKNNLFGLGAGSSNPYANARSFASKEESIYYAASLLRNSYLSRGSRFYSGDSLQHIGVYYAADPQWATKVSGAMSRIARAAIPEGR